MCVIDLPRPRSSLQLSLEPLAIHLACIKQPDSRIPAFFLNFDAKSFQLDETLPTSYSIIDKW
jgi:hypothetical protein